MSAECWKIEKDLCRCCHSEGSHKNLNEPCLQGEEEKFSDMLHETLDINIPTVTGPLCTVTYTICEVCIMRLQDAWSFKQQVLQCENRFKDLYTKNFIKMDPDCVVISVKEEAGSDDEGLKEEKLGDSDDDFEMAFGDGNISNDSDMNMDTEEKTAKGKPKAKAKTKVKAASKAAPKKKTKPTTKSATSTDGQDDGQAKEKKGGKAAKFRLTEQDYTRDGDIYECSRCDKRYDKFHSLKFHVKTKHYQIARFPCPYCEEKFKTIAPLTVHKLNAHKVDDRSKCNACKAIFNTKIQLRKHLNNFHMMGEQYKCEFCEYVSFSFENLYKHKFKHKTVKDYQCRFCKKAFLRNTTMELHERIHTGDRRKVCQVCSKAFVQKASLNYHMTKYHPEVNF